jgi:hypothetical protein
MNIVSLNPEPQAAAPPADSLDPSAPPKKKKRRATGEQIRRLVRDESDRRDPITVARGLVDHHPELAVSSFRWLVRQAAWALALSSCATSRLYAEQDPPTASKGPAGNSTPH